VKTGLASWAGGLGFGPKPYREWKIFYVSQILFIISNPFELNSKLNMERLLFAIYNAKAHVSTNKKYATA
jgi:hypothetical protein